MVVAESKRVLMTGSSLESVGTGTTVLRAEKMCSTKKVPSQKAGLSASCGGPGEKRRKRRTRSQCVPEAGGSVMALRRMAAPHWQQPIYHPGGVSGVIMIRSHWANWFQNSSKADIA